MGKLFSTTNTDNATVLDITIQGSTTSLVDASGNAVIPIATNVEISDITAGSGFINPANMDTAIMQHFIDDKASYGAAEMLLARKKIGALESLSSGYNIKTVNGSDITGAGNVDVGVTDVQDAAGTSFVPSASTIATIPMASTDKNGLVKLKHALQGGITTESGLLVLSKNNLNGEAEFNIADRATSNHFYAVTTKNMDNGLKAAMCDGVGAAWGDGEKAAAGAKIGAIDSSYHDNTKQDLLVGDATHGIDGQPFNIPYYFHTTPATDKITVSADTVKFENGTSVGHYNTFNMDVPSATTATAGLMSATDKDKLDKSASLTDLNTEKSAREAADNNLLEKINTETTRATTEEAALNAGKLNILTEDPSAGFTVYNLPYYFYTVDDTDKITVHAKTITLDNNKTKSDYSLDVKAATTEKAGLMSKDDKLQIAKNASDISNEVTRAKAEEDKKLNIPGADPVSGKTYNLPYYFYTDEQADKVVVHAKTISLDNNKIQGDYSLDVNTATTEKAGLMSKDDKIQITNNTTNIAAEIARATAEEAKKVEKLITSGSNKSLIFNEVDGGGSKYEHADGTWSYVGVHDGGTNGIAAQIYAVDSTDNYKGTKFDVKKDGIYYTTGEASGQSPAQRDVATNEIATKGNIAKEAAIRESVDNTKQDLLKGDATHGIDGLPFNIPYYFYTTPGADKVTVYADTVKFENGESALHYNTFSMDVNAATSTAAGLMSNVDKVKLDNLVKVSGTFDDINWHKITIDGVERNIPNASGVKESTILLANNWAGNTYSLEDIYPSKAYDIDVELSNTATENEYQDFADAVITGNKTNNTLTALGTVPKINIPVIITKRAR